MATEYKLSYTGSEINAKLGKIDSLAEKSKIPTNISQLNNDSGFITSYTETDPTVPAWAKASTKPTYTAGEVGADASGTANSLISAHNTATDAHADIRTALNNKLSSSELQAAINTSLAQAKASGEFDGAAGKTAYAYAQDGGYTGTEAEFAEKLASDSSAGTFVINVIAQEDESAILDKTAEEVSAALDAGMHIVCDAIFPGEEIQYRLQFLGIQNPDGMKMLSFGASIQSSTFIVMIAIMGDVISASALATQGDITIGGLQWVGIEPVDFTDTINNMIAAKIPTALKNPNALTINGVSYDGSETKDFTDAINTMIDSKLASITNAEEVPF